MFSLRDLENALGVKAITEDRTCPLRGVSIDSRTLHPGEIFFAVRGKNCDGHAFVAEASARGAGAFVLERQWSGKTGLRTDRPVFLVEDTTVALGQLASYHRRRCGVRSIGITGTCGKTTTKEIGKLLLSRRLQVLSTAGNLNNQFGLPLTIFRLEANHEILLAELGASRRNDIHYLTGILEPDIGLITNIYPAHLEGFGSVENIYNAKLELAASLEMRGGTLAVNGDQPELLQRAHKFRVNLVSFGRGKGNDFAVTRLTEAGGAIEFEINRRHRFQIKSSAYFHADNFLAAIVIAHLAGIPLEALEGALEAFRPLTGRFERHDLPQEITVIHDAYNANPGSMIQSLISFAAWKQLGSRKIALLGDMMELGPDSEKLHYEIGRELKLLGIPVLITVGEWAAEIARGASDTKGCSEIYSFKTHAEAIKFLCWFKKAGDAILLKGSRAMKLEEILEGLKHGRVPESQEVS